MNMKMTKLLVMLGMLACISACSDQNYWPHTTFSPESWKNTSESERYIFVNDLLQRQLLLGKNKAQIIELLGSPSEELIESHSIIYLVKSGGNSFDQIFILDIRFQGEWTRATVIGIRGD